MVDIRVGFLSNKTMAEQSLADEMEAINAYTSRQQVVGDPFLQKIIANNLWEEREHAGILNSWLYEFWGEDTGFVSNSREGLASMIASPPTPFTADYNKDVTIAQDSLREEARAVQAYSIRGSRVNMSESGGELLYDKLVRDLLLDELKHAHALFTWLSRVNPKWSNFGKETGLIHATSFSEADIYALEPLLIDDESFMPKQSDWAPWQGPNPYITGSRIRSTRTSPGVERYKEPTINVLRGNLPLSFDKTLINKVLMQSDNFPRPSRKVVKDVTYWDPDAADPLWHTQGAVLTRQEVFYAPYKPFEPEITKTLSLALPDVKFEITGQTAADYKHDGPMSVVIRGSSVTRTYGQEYWAQMADMAEYYKKSVTIREFDDILLDMRDALAGKAPFRYSGKPSAPKTPAEAAARRQIREARQARAEKPKRPPLGQQPSPGRIGIGSKVHVEFLNGSSGVLQIVQHGDSDVPKGKVSIDSPMGAALMGHRVGDTVGYNAPGGRFAMKIISVK